MGFYRGANVVTSGLVLALDAANPKSYPGSGTTWSDLSRDNYTGTLTNGPTFNSANGGSIAFDGVNDYVELTTRNTNLEFQPTQPYSCFVFYRSPLVATSGALIANMDNNGTTYPGWDLWFNNGSTPNTIGMHLISAWSTNCIKIRVDYNFATYANQWVFFGYTYNGSCPTNITDSLNSVNFYLNGVLYTSGKVMADATDGFNTSSETITYNSNQRFRLASRWLSGTATSQAQSTIANVNIYNRALSASEVQQNYNAQKSRFDL
jgi:hypothetical protein